MAEEKNESEQVNFKEGLVPPTINKAFKAGVPPNLNLAGEIIQGGNVPPLTNLAGQIIEKENRGMAPQALPKIPLDQVAKPSQSSGSSSNASDGSSGDQSGGESASGEKK